MKPPSKRNLNRVAFRASTKRPIPPIFPDSTLCKQANAIRHMKLITSAIRSAEADFLRELVTIDPTFPWKLNTAGRRVGKEFMGDGLTFTFDTIHYTRDAAGLTHTDACVSSIQVNLQLVKRVRVQKVQLEITLNIYSNLTEDHKRTLRQCGAMREVTETRTYTDTRTIVQCEI